MVKVWDPSDWSLSEPLEIFVPKGATMHEMGVLLEGKLGGLIPLADMEC